MHVYMFISLTQALELPFHWINQEEKHVQITQKYADYTKKSIDVWDGRSRIDVVITFRFPLSFNHTTLPRHIPIVHFYTAVDGSFQPNFLSLDELSTYNGFDGKVRDLAMTDQHGFLSSLLSTHSSPLPDFGHRLFFFTSSSWQTSALSSLAFPHILPKARNQVLKPGVELKLFKKDAHNALKDKIRIGFKKEDVLLIMVNSLYSNQRILDVFTSMCTVLRHGVTQYKLILKGSDIMYRSDHMLQFNVNILKSLAERNNITSEEISTLTGVKSKRRRRKKKKKKKKPP